MGGVNVARVKSISMDDWSATELRRMTISGNDKLDRYFKASFVKRNLRLSLSDSFESWGCTEKYDSNTADQYREKLDLLVQCSMQPSSNEGESVTGEDTSAPAAREVLRQLSCPPEYVA